MCLQNVVENHTRSTDFMIKLAKTDSRMWGKWNKILDLLYLDVGDFYSTLYGPKTKNRSLTIMRPSALKQIFISKNLWNDKWFWSSLWHFYSEKIRLKISFEKEIAFITNIYTKLFYVIYSGVSTPRSYLLFFRKWLTTTGWR